LVPPALAAVTTLVVAVRSRSAFTPVVAAGAAAFLATLALAIEIGEGLRRSTNGEYFSWHRIEDLATVTIATVLHATVGAAIGAAIVGIFFIARRYRCGRPTPHAR